MTLLFKRPQRSVNLACNITKNAFPIQDKQGRLLCSHGKHIMQTSDPQQIIRGNERVMRARLSDAAFFFAQDQQRPLATRVPELNSITYQEKLGSLYDKA